MTYNDEWTISDYGLSQQELEVQEVAPLFDKDEFDALFCFDPEKFSEEVSLSKLCRPAEPKLTVCH